MNMKYREHLKTLKFFKLNMEELSKNTNKVKTKMEFSEAVKLIQESIDLAIEDKTNKLIIREGLPNQGAKRQSIKGRAVHNFVRDLLKERQL